MATLPADAALADDLIEEFFLRLPPEDPSSLVHAALVCKRWRRILADRGFRRRFCKHHHRRPPLLGYFCSVMNPTDWTWLLSFTPTSSFRPRDAVVSFGYALDSRHGRVLVLLPHVDVGLRQGRQDPSDCRLSVWDPIMGGMLSLPRLPERKPLTSPLFIRYNFTWNAAVLCASSGALTAAVCDDSDCHGRPFLVVFVGTWHHEVYAYVYSSHTGVWSHTASVARETLCHLGTAFGHSHTGIRSKAVAGNAVYFKLLDKDDKDRILKYDLGTREISSVDLPEGCREPHPMLLLTAAEYGGLFGVAILYMSRIDIWWASEAGPDDSRLRWEPAQSIELQENLSFYVVVDIVHGLGAIIINGHDGVFSVDIESKRMTKLCEDKCTSWFVPYLSFCTPALGVPSTGEGSSAGVYQNAVSTTKARNGDGFTSQDSDVKPAQGAITTAQPRRSVRARRGNIRISGSEWA